MGRRLIVELDDGSPPSGRVIAADGGEVAFAGWTELAQALQPGAAETAASAEPPAGASPPG